MATRKKQATKPKNRKELIQRQKALKDAHKQILDLARADFRNSITPLLCLAEVATKKWVATLAAKKFSDINSIEYCTDKLHSCLWATGTFLELDKQARAAKPPLWRLQNGLDNALMGLREIGESAPPELKQFRDHLNELGRLSMKLEMVEVALLECKRAAAESSPETEEYKYFLALKKKYEEQNSL